jgi:aspartate/methionine/tyrosine aminotransferase
VQPAQATSIAFVRMHFDMTSYDFAEAVRTRGNVLIAPGSTLGAEHHLRITVGYPEDVIRTSLQRVSAVADALGM